MYLKLSMILFLSSCRKPRCNCICTCSSSPRWRIWSLEVPWNVPLVVNHAWGENVNRGRWRNPMNHQFWMVESRRKSWDVYHLSTGDLDFAGPSIVFPISPLFHLFWGCGLLTKMVSPLDQGGQSQSSSLEATVADGSMVNFSTYFLLQLLYEVPKSWLQQKVGGNVDVKTMKIALAQNGGKLMSRQCPRIAKNIARKEIRKKGQNQLQSRRWPIPRFHLLRCEACWRSNCVRLWCGRNSLSATCSEVEWFFMSCRLPVPEAVTVQTGYCPVVRIAWRHERLVFPSNCASGQGERASAKYWTHTVLQL